MPLTCCAAQQPPLMSRPAAMQGNQRDLAFSVVYLIDMAKAMVERTLQVPEAQARA